MHGMLRGVVAVDGPSGTGKSTTARGLAMRLDARYLDTGAMYRAATLAVLRSDVPLDVAKTAAEGNDDVVAVALGARVELSTDPAEPRVRLDGEDVDAEIRGTRGDRGGVRGLRAHGRPRSTWWTSSGGSSPRSSRTAAGSSSRAATSAPS